MYVYLNCKANRVNKQIEVKSGWMSQIDFVTADGEVFAASCTGLTRATLDALRKDYQLLKFKLTVSLYKDVPQANFWGPLEDRPAGLDDDEVIFADM